MSSQIEKENNKLLKDAQALRTLFHKVTSQHMNRMKSMQSDPRWADLANEKTLARLTALSLELEAEAKDQFTEDFMSHEIGDIKKQYSKDMGKLYFNIRGMLDSMEPKVRSLYSEHMRLHKMMLAGS